MTEVIINGGVQCDVYEITAASVSKGAGGILDRLTFTTNRPNNTLLQGSLLYLSTASNAVYNGRYTAVSGTAGSEEFSVVADAKQADGSTPRSLKGLPALTSGSIGGYFGYLTRERRIDWYNHLTGPNYIDVSPGAAIDCSTMVPYIPFLPD